MHMQAFAVRRFAAPFLAVLKGSLGLLAAAAAFAGPPNATVVEYYRAASDHYFMTASPHEQAVLDEGIHPGWARTGRTFLAWTDAGRAPPTARAVCRFLGRPEAGLDSHFYSAFGSECAAVAQRFPHAWLLESSSVFYVDAPDAGTGSCGEGTDPVYRVYNNRSDVNHRYVRSMDDRAAMIASGWIAEGFGPLGVALCASRPLTSASDVAYVDPTTYSSMPGGSLASAVDAAAVTHHTMTLQGTELPYIATAGHLVTRDSSASQPQASMFYVAYTAQGRDAATRPITFFFNGGPGSATIWLHLGSFGPKRLATGGPSAALPRPYAFVHNDESLLDVSDLVFVDAVGAGLSQAIAPFTNQSLWSVDLDARVFRNFIRRYIEVNGRDASPKFIFGESYGAVRAAVLANLLESAGVELSGVVLQSSVLDYNSNCGVVTLTMSCAAYVPSYAAVADHHGVVDRGPLSQDAFLNEARAVAVDAYGPAVVRFLQNGTLPDDSLISVLTRYTGITATEWTARFNYPPGLFQSRLIPGTLLGRYDARVSARAGSLLAIGGDPSSNLITGSFIGAIQPHLQTLKYTYASPYISLSDAIFTWDFSHAGRILPDTIPDLAAALAQNPRMAILSLSGYHDLATPFFLTERDLARLGPLPNVTIRNYDGGHMTYLDDNSRRLERADLVTMFRRLLLPSVATTGRLQ
jgi:carboxypeptidase C (cathepsin A)